MSFSVAALIAGAGAPGCGADAPPKLVDSTQFGAAYGQALCTSLQHCCAENAVAYDYTACSTGWERYVQTSYLSALDSTYNAKAANDCLAKIRAASSAPCVPSQGSVSDARDACIAIFQGTKPVGTPCSSAAECMPVAGSRVVCDVPGGTGGDGGTLPLSFGIRAVPVCTVIQPPAPGEPCALKPGDPGVADCQALYCDPTTKTCQERGSEGQPCMPGSCASGLYCAAATTGGSCASVSPLGSPCGTSDQCDATGRCDLGAKLCVPRSPPGSACTTGSDCQIGICDATTKKCLQNGFATTAACNGRGP
jgi:hypothetical protein